MTGRDFLYIIAGVFVGYGLDDLFLRFRPVSAAACFITAALYGIWIWLATPTKTTIL
jgi:hypothetical protein